MRLLFLIISVFGGSVVLWGCWAFNEQRRLAKKKIASALESGSNFDAAPRLLFRGNRASRISACILELTRNG